MDRTQLDDSTEDGHRAFLIDRILASDAGIFGREVCQACGRQGSFHGFNGAMGSHAGGCFICWDCRRSGAATEYASDPGYCSVCAMRRPIVRLRHHRLCLDCAQSLEVEAAPVRAAAAIEALGRRRHLDVQSTSALEVLAVRSVARELHQQHDHDADCRAREYFQEIAAQQLAGETCR